ncbi:MAG: DHA2 family efflux MFS transporter permease subunit [Dehalococcoidia bacterium]|nr:MAG: DHA2 family efflux MFS transporter permease subunit [Dehalococcoidia bacterium]
MDSPPVKLGLRALPRRQIVLTMAGVLMALFMSSLDQTIVNTAMPRIIVDLNGFAHYTWIITIYIITSAITIPIIGKLTDMYGRKPFYIAGIVIFTISSFLSGLSQSMMQLIIFRGIQGIGAGAMIANAFTVIADIFPPAERGKYQGIISAVFGISAIVGPSLGGFITDTLSWHWIFFVNVPIGTAVVVLFILFFPDVRPAAGHRHQVDYPGIFTLSVGVAALLLALSWGGAQYPWNSFPVIGLLALFAVMLVAFLYTEIRSREPIIPLSLFGNRIVAVSEIVVFLTAFGMFGAITFVPLFFQGVLGATATASGGFLTPMILGQVSGSFISGQLLSRTGGHYRVQGVFGLGLMAVGIFFLSRMGTDTSFVVAIVNIVMTGFGLGMTMPLYTIAVQNTVPYNMLGVATSSVPFIRSIGASVGLAIFGSTMTSRFAAEFTGRLSPALRDALPAAQIDALGHNPQTLLSAASQAELKDFLMQASPQGSQLFDQLQETLKQALSSALREVFIISLITAVLAIGVHLFIKEIPLRKEHRNR